MSCNFYAVARGDHDAFADSDARVYRHLERFTRGIYVCDLNGGPIGIYVPAGKFGGSGQKHNVLHASGHRMCAGCRGVAKDEVLRLFLTDENGLFSKSRLFQLYHENGV